MTKLILAATAAISLYACSPKMAAHTPVTDANGNKMLLGVCTKNDLLAPSFKEWFTKNQADYTVDITTTNLLKDKLTNKQFTIFMGTWCGDSKREVPRIYKVLEQSGVKQKQITLVTVNNSDSAYKQSPGHEERGLNIHRVPTLIVWEGGKEKARIIETPVISWEKDLLAIANNENYTPRYAGVELLQQQFAAHGVDGVLKDSVNVAAKLKGLLKSEYELSAYGKMLRTSGYMAQALTTTVINTVVFPAKADAWYVAGIYQQLAGNNTQAKVYFQQTLALQPSHENATKQLTELNKQ